MGSWTLPLLALLVAFVAGAFLLRRAPAGPKLWGAVAWTFLLVGGVVAEVRWLPGLEPGKALVALFTPFLLAGVLETAGWRIPRWFIPAAIVLAAFRGWAGWLGWGELGEWISLTLDPTLLLVAAFVTWKTADDDEIVLRRILAPAIALLAIPRILDSLSDLQGGEVFAALPVWIAFTIPVAVLQLVLGAQSNRRAALAARQELSENLRRFEAIAGSSFDLISEADADGRFLYVSPGYETVLGYRPEQLIGRGPISLVHPDDRVHVLGASDPPATPGLSHPPVRMRHRDGSWRLLEGTARRYRNGDGIERIVMVHRDVTERVELAERMQRAQRLDSLGMLAGGIAHDFNNLLVPILGNASLLREERGPDDPDGEILRDLEEGAQRAAELSHQLLAFAGRSHRQLAPQDLSEIASSVTRLFEPNLATGIELRTKLSNGMPPVLGDETQLRQVVMNLVVNATDAVGEGGGRVAVETGTVALEPSDLARLDAGNGLVPGTFVHLDVGDDGCGMDAATRERIFEPFFTTKARGQGLGLAVALGIVRAHGGAIHVWSELEEGTTFRVLLPVMEGEARTDATAASLEPATDAWEPGGTILVVDDEASVRRVARSMLELRGFDVVEAGNGGEAIELFRRSPDRFAAVLLDIVMPVLRGDEVYLEMARLRPDVPVVFSSGFSERDVRERVPEGARVEVLAKPYGVEPLIRAVRHVVEDD